MNKKKYYIYIIMGDLHMAYQTDRPRRSFSIGERIGNSWGSFADYGEVPWIFLSALILVVGGAIGVIYGIYRLIVYLTSSKKDSTPATAPPPEKTTTTDTTSPPKSDDDKNK